MALHLHLFGPPRLDRDGVAIPLNHRKAWALLAYLAVTARAHSRDSLATLLWPDYGQSDARGHLRRELARLRDLVGEERFVADREQIALAAPATGPAALLVDVIAFQEAVAAAQQCRHAPASDCPTCRPHLIAADGCYTDHFLAGFTLPDSPAFDDWQFFQRDQLSGALGGVLARLVGGGDERDGRDRGDGAREGAGITVEQRVQYARRWVAHDPLHEPAHRALMMGYLQAGQPAAALRQYETCRRLLLSEFGVEPTVETQTLYAQLRAGGFDLQARSDAAKQSKPESADSPAPVSSSVSRPLSIDWGEAPTPGLFYGRSAEVERLTQWVIKDRCRLVTVVGIGGMGKTTLTVQVVQRLAAQMEQVIWRSLLNAPPLATILPGWLQRLADQPDQFRGQEAQSLDAQLNQLFELLQRRRCLLVLDNLETIMQEESHSGRYRPGYEAYGQLLQRFGESNHQSCLLLTSREQPQEVARLERTQSAVRTLPLTGLAVADGFALLATQGVTGATAQAAQIIAHYSGNPLALLLVGETIQELFGGDVTAFLQADLPIFDDIRTVLAQHFARLSSLERDLLLWLAIEREPLTTAQLGQTLAQPAPTYALLDAIHSLRRRSLLEQTKLPDDDAQRLAPGEQRSGFTLQNVVIEYLTTFLIDQSCQEIETGRPQLLKSHALLKAQAKEHVRQSQVRLIVQPLLDRLLARWGRTGVEEKIKALLVHVRGEPDRRVGYGGGNLLNLLVQLSADLTALDCSQMMIRQAYLPHALLPGANFAGAHFKDCVFPDTFGVIVALAFHPNGRLLAAGAANDSKVRIWRLSDGQCLAVLAAHSNIVWALDFSPDGTRLASGSQDHTICLWDMHAIEQGAEGLKPLHTLTAHTRGIGHLVFAPDGCRLASAGADQVAHLWESATGRLLATLTGLPAGYNCLTFSPEGALLASAGGDGVVRLWHIGKILDPRLPSPTATAAAMACLSGPSARVGVLAFSPDGRQLASGSANGDLCLWELSSLAVDARADQQAPPARHLQGHTKTITTIFFRPDGQLISVSEDRTLRRWVVNGADPTVACHGLQGYTSGIWYTAVTADGQFLAGGGGDRTVRLWSLTSGTLVQTLHGHAQGVMALALSPDGTLLATAYQDHQVRLWTMATRTLQSVLHGHTDEIEALAWGVAPTGERLLLASGDVEQKIHLWEPVPGRLCQTLVGDAGWIHALAFHPRQGWLVSASGDAQIRRWQIDYPAGKAAPLTPLVVNGVDGADGVIFRAVAVHPVAPVIAAGGNHGAIYLWQQDSSGVWQRPLALQGHTNWITVLTFSPDGEWLASGSYDRTIRLWRWRTGEVVQILHGHTDWVWSVAFPPQATANQHLVASGGADNSVRLWEARSGQLRQTLQGHTNWVRAVTFSADGATLISGSSDETLKWWDVATGACLTTVRALRPFEGANLADATGPTAVQQTALITLGAMG